MSTISTHIYNFFCHKNQIDEYVLIGLSRLTTTYFVGNVHLKKGLVKLSVMSVLAGYHLEKSKWVPSN